MFQLCIFFFGFLSQLIIISSYTLVGRSNHTANYIDNKIYFLGGETETNTLTNDFFYLDVSNSFSLNSTLPIFDLTNNAQFAQLPNHTNAISTACSLDTIFLFSEIFENHTSTAFKFANYTGWSKFTSIEDRWLSAVCDENMTIYIFVVSNDTKKNIITLNTSQLRWSLPIFVKDLIVSPQEGNIVNIGNNRILCLNDLRIISLYDIKSNVWSRVTVVGISPASRSLYTTVLTSDGFIIVYGGVRSDGNTLNVPELIFVLHVNFTWYIPRNNIPSSAPIFGHTATLVGNYMIIAFGNSFIGQSNQIHLIDVSDISNFKWVKDFTANSAPQSIIIIGGTIGGIASIILIVSVSYLLYRKKRTVIYAPQAKHAINC